MTRSNSVTEQMNKATRGKMFLAECQTKRTAIVDDNVSLLKCMTAKSWWRNIAPICLSSNRNSYRRNSKMSCLRSYLRRKRKKEKMPNSLINEMLEKWNEMKNFVEMNPPDKTIASLIVRSYNSKMGLIL